jgi:hypothetical protein
MAIERDGLLRALRDLGHDPDTLGVDLGRLLRRVNELIGELKLVGDPGRDLVRRAIRSALTELVGKQRPPAAAASKITYVGRSDDGERRIRLGPLVVTMSEVREHVALAEFVRELEAQPRGESQVEPVLAPRLLEQRWLDPEAKAALAEAGIDEPTEEQYLAALTDAQRKLEVLS